MRAGISSEKSSSRRSGIRGVTFLHPPLQGRVIVCRTPAPSQTRPGAAWSTECSRHRQRLMRAAAERLCRGLLAGTEPHLFALRRRPLHWRERGALVRAVAERLVLRLAARAPPVVLAGFDIDADRLPSSNRTLLRHGRPPQDHFTRSLRSAAGGLEPGFAARPREIAHSQDVA